MYKKTGWVETMVVIKWFKSIVCWAMHRQYHTEIECDLRRIGSPADVGKHGKGSLFLTHLWSVWTVCGKCGRGWTSTKEQNQAAWDVWEDHLPAPPPVMDFTDEGTRKLAEEVTALTEAAVAEEKRAKRAKRTKKNEND